MRGYFVSLQKKILIFSLLILASSGLFSQQINHWESVVLSNDTWHYIVPVSEPPSDWNTVGFDDSGWLTGKGGIGYGDNDDSTILVAPVGSVFMRTTFGITDKSAISYAVLHLDYDDGFVAYLNGHEIARDNIGTAGVKPAYSDFAINCIEPKMPFDQLPPSFLINKDTVAKYLSNGTNVLAIQVHNCNLASSDLSSTAFFSVGITNSNEYYRRLPPWFDITVTTTSTLPIISIDTHGQDIPDEPKIMATCKVINNTGGKVNDITDPGTDYTGEIGIELRGQSSQMFPKKPYSIELRKNSTIDTAASLLGMPANKDWVLHAHYSDKSMMRNALTYYFGAKLGRWQPRFRYCVVYINGDYQGLYLLLESIKRDSSRVNISHLAYTDNSGDELTGGYIVKVDKTWNLTQNDYFTTYPSIMIADTRNYNFTYVYPKADSITSYQKTYISKFLTDFENALNNSNVFKNPENGFRKYLNLQSFVDYQIMEELVNNVDGYRYSTFFTKDKITHGDKLNAGPLWDHDLCYGNVDYSPINLSTSGWLYPHYGPNEGYPMHWWARLMQDPDYTRMFVARWRELRRNEFRTENFMHFIDSVRNYLGGEVARNFQKWQILGVYVWPNYYVGQTYDEEITWLKYWITDRLNWMDSATELNSDLDKQGFDDQVTIYPLPVKDKLTIEYKVSSTAPVTIELLDLYGKKIYETNIIPPEAGNDEYILDMSTYGTSYLILRIRQGEKVIGIRKVIKY